MRALDIITDKRDGKPLSRDQINWFIQSYVKGEIPDYQVAALLMAVYFQGMTSEETAVLTREMIASGETIDLSGVDGPFVDKHSTGGVGDKVSLVLAPLVASLGVRVPMMSGRSLGHTGGTLDKLESIPGYRIARDKEEFRSILNSVGYAMTGQSDRIAPADRLLYALRDVTGTVESVPLITSSILSKKFAEGADALVFDVKCGKGAFMKTMDDARALARALVDAGDRLGKRIVAVMTNMGDPLGHMVGNFLEAEESALCLRGEGPPDLMEITLRLSAWMLVAGEKVPDVDAGLDLCTKALAGDRPWRCFLDNIRAQHGDPDRFVKTLGTRRAKLSHAISAPEGGYVAAIDAYSVGMACVYLGAGRSRADDDVLPNVGVELAKKRGDAVSANETVCTLFAETDAAMEQAVELVEKAYSFTSAKPAPEKMILEELAEI